MQAESLDGAGDPLVGGEDDDPVEPACLRHTLVDVLDEGPAGMMEERLTGV